MTQNIHGEFEASCHVIPHKDQRYPTAGDWQFYMGRLTLRVSKLPDPRYQQLIALHELVEALLCRWTGVTENEVTDWDIDFQYHAENNTVTGEPGDHPEAPYHRQHVIASVVERLAAQLLGVDWNDYNKAVDGLDEDQ